MARYRCYQCKDPRRRPGVHHEFEGDRPLCPKCGAGEPAVLELTPVHFLFGAPDGPIEGKNGLRYRAACEPGREVLAVHALDQYAATGDPRAVTCPSCMGTPAYKRAAGFVKELRGVMIQGDGCCGG
jgi:hypothetical protein